MSLTADPIAALSTDGDPMMASVAGAVVVLGPDGSRHPLRVGQHACVVNPHAQVRASPSPAAHMFACTLEIARFAVERIERELIVGDLADIQ
ncbi:hypothetical protein I546_0334 [Mycobacterium kansasii 732]|nr:hypothetical protein I546_0334 [Mycobacterium kansasii 732]